MFELPEETRMLRDLVREFVRRELGPHERLHSDGNLPAESLVSVQEKAREIGLWLLDVPAAFGGADLDTLSLVVVWEELYQSAVLPDRGVTVFGPQVGPILFELSADQQQRYLFPVLRGEQRTCFAQTEPDAGSDPGSMKTVAVADGDSWELTGVKRYITGAESADFYQVLAVTDPELRQKGGITCFLVDRDAPGVSLGSYAETLSGERVYEILFDRVRLGSDQVAGQVGEGFALAQRWIVKGRLHQAARALAIAQRSLAMAVPYAQQRRTFGRPLLDRQAIQFLLVDSHIGLESARLFLRSIAARSAGGQDVRYDAAAAKVLCVETAAHVVDAAIQVHGGMGLTTDLPLARWAADLRTRRITEGATEVLRSYISRSLPALYSRSANLGF